MHLTPAGLPPEQRRAKVPADGIPVQPSIPQAPYGAVCRRQTLKPLLIASNLLLLAGCTSYGKIDNEPRATTEDTAGSYSIEEYISTHD